MEKPLISIIIPVFNASETIDACLNSAIQQTWENHEIIVIDGGSDEVTIQKIKKHSEGIVYFLSEKDRGVYDAINKGLAQAKGDWIFILGSDDQFASPSVLEEVFSIPIKSEKIVFGNVQQTDINHTLVRSLHKSKFNRSIFWRNTLHQQSVFYHNSLFYSFRFDIAYRVLADYDFHLLLYNQGIPFRSIPLTIAICSAGGLSKKFTFALYQEELRIKKRRLNNFLYAANCVWVWMKFAIKNITR
jgi:glycosyltransferase involved in cell wall biosynthesis